MSEAFVCDRCGVTISGQPPMQVGTQSTPEPGGNVGSKVVDSDGGRLSIGIQNPIDTLGAGKRSKTYIIGGDLCEDCADAFRDFWTEPDNANEAS